MKLFNKGHVNIRSAMEEALQQKQSAKAIEKIALRGAKTYVGIYLANLLFGTGVVAFSNRMTKEGLKEDLKALKNSAPPAQPLKKSALTASIHA